MNAVIGIAQAMFSRRVLRQSLLTIAAAAVALAAMAVPSVANYETGVAQSPYHRSGEPGVAVDPTHPSNMIYVATKFERRVLYQFGIEIPNIIAQFTPWVWGYNQLYCWLSISSDYGTTWTAVPFPTQYPGCADPRAAAGPDGTFYVASHRYGDPIDDNVPFSTPASVGVSRSTDGGRTWSVNVATGVPTAGGPPNFRVDQKTGYLWVNMGPTCDEPLPCGKSLAYSRDKGDTWTVVNHPVTEYNTLPPPAPGGAWYLPGSEPFRGNNFAVYDNILAFVYEGQFCVLQLSPADDGTGAYYCRTIPGTAGMTGTGGLSGNPISADPTKSGRFAIMLRSGSSSMVFVTEDAGATWSQPTSVDTGAGGFDMPWFDYSPSRIGPSGLLGIMWRSDTPDGKIDVKSVVSNDNGVSFSQPKTVNAVSFPPQAATDGPGDDYSFLSFGAGEDGKPNAYIVWGDTRNGPVEGWFGRVPVASYLPEPALALSLASGAALVAVLARRVTRRRGR